ncbi:MAG TPA: cupin domain-containing protein, partial [Chloroflexota bacterium]|nr:cupin domain-containing protein [Chloroflexota bacterium]
RTMAVALPTLNTEQRVTSLQAIKARHGAPPWSERIVVNDRCTTTVICQAPGHSNDWHYHLVDEWWMIAEGEQAWEIEGFHEPHFVKAGDFVYVPAGHYHLIHVLGEAPAIRIAVSYTGEHHRHERDVPPTPPRPQEIEGRR